MKIVPVLGALLTAALLTAFASASAAAPSGGRILFIADGSSPRRLVAGSIEDFSWSPDSTRIVFTRTTMSKGLRQIYLVSLHGAPRLFVKAPAEGMTWRASWSPDGRTIARSSPVTTCLSTGSSSRPRSRSS